MDVSNNINFKASFVKNVKVKQQTKFSKLYFPKKVSMVKLITNDKNDIAVLNTLNKDWKPSFLDNIQEYFNYPNTETYVITEQKDNFSNLMSKKILGIAQIRKDDDINKCILDFLQVKPDMCFGTDKKRRFKNVGKTFINFFKHNCNFSLINLLSIISAEDFYLKNGFKRVSKDEQFFIWKKKTFFD